MKRIMRNYADFSIIRDYPFNWCHQRAFVNSSKSFIQALYIGIDGAIPFNIKEFREKVVFIPAVRPPTFEKGMNYGTQEFS